MSFQAVEKNWTSWSAKDSINPFSFRATLLMYARRFLDGSAVGCQRNKSPAEESLPASHKFVAVSCCGTFSQAQDTDFIESIRGNNFRHFLRSNYPIP